MPNDIETIFEANSLSLFPRNPKDLVTDCSCPDWSNPCKHVAAVYCLLGEEFDQDPFLLFRLRGMSRDELVKRLTGSVPDEAGETAPQPLDPATFWTGAWESPALRNVRTPPVSVPLLRRIGGFPFWRDSVPLRESLEPIYARVGERGLEICSGGG